MNDVSTFRLYVLRGMYLLWAVGLGLMIWPLLLGSPENAEHMRGVTWSLLGGLALIALLGLRYPLQMLPLLFFEFVWKAIWVLLIGLPLYLGDGFTPATRDTWNSCLVGIVLVPLVIPWRYVFENYVRRPGDRWRRAPVHATHPAAGPGSVRPA